MNQNGEGDFSVTNPNRPYVEQRNTGRGVSSEHKASTNAKLMRDKR